MKIGISFSGGGARGIAHLGVLKALLEHNIEVEIISGTSAGSIAGAMYSAGYDPEEILNIIMSSSVIKTLRPSFNKMGLLKIDALGEILKKYLKNKKFSDLKIPLTVVATDIEQGVAKYFNDGMLIPAVKASSCVPFFFSPVEYEGIMYVDGGVVDNLPTKIIKNECDYLIGVHTNPINNGNKVANMKVILERSLLIAINGNVFESKKLCDWLIEPPELSNYTGFDLGKAKEIFNIGYRHTLKTIPGILLKNQLL